MSATEILERRSREALERRAQRAQSREANRQAMPEITAFVDAMREHFPGLRVLYASENGIERGERQDEGVALTPAWRPFKEASRTDRRGLSTGEER